MADEDQPLVQLGSALQRACKPSYVPFIQQGREQLKALARDWVLANIDKVANEALDLSDYWEYRRLLEVLVMLEARDSLEWFIRAGLVNADFDIREAAEDFEANAVA